MSKLIALASGQQVAIDNIDVNLPPSLITLFGRLKVAANPTQISARFNAAQWSLLCSRGQVSGTGGSGAIDTTASRFTITQNTSIGYYRIRSNVAGLYIAGNALLCLMTFCFGDTGEANLYREVGYRDDSDGIFLRQHNGQLSIVLRSSVSGSVVETSVNQSDWGDPSNEEITSKFNGAVGDSLGYNFNHSNCHIFWIALEYLGVGDVYTGFVNNARFVIANIFRNPNRRDKPYMRTADLFCEYGIRRTVSGGTSRSFNGICFTLQSEGTDTRQGFVHEVDMGAARTTSNSTTVYYILMTMRLNPSRVNARVLLQSLEYKVSDSQTTDYRVLVVRNPTITGGSLSATWSDMPDCSIQYQGGSGFNNNALTVAEGAWERLIDLTAASGTAANQLVSQSINVIIPEYMTVNALGTPDVWAVIVKSSTGNSTVKDVIARMWEQL